MSENTVVILNLRRAAAGRKRVSRSPNTKCRKSRVGKDIPLMSSSIAGSNDTFNCVIKYVN